MVAEIGQNRFRNKRRILAAALVPMLLFLLLFQGKETAAAASSCKLGIKGNGTSGIYIDINAAPYNTIFLKNQGGYEKYAYVAQGCAWFASARVNQLTGKGTTIFSGSSWYSWVYKEYGFQRGSTLRPGALACYSTHVAVVEAVNGDIVTVSQGGMKGLSDKDHGYCIISTMTSAKLRTQGGCGKFLGYVYLGVTATPEIKEEITNIPEDTEYLSEVDSGESSEAIKEGAAEQAPMVDAVPSVQEISEKSAGELSTLKATEAKAEDSVYVPKKTSISLKKKTAVYTGKRIAIDAAVVTGSSKKPVYTYYTDKACTKGKSTKAPINAGTYYVKASVAADNLYQAAESSPVKLKIVKAVQSISNVRTSIQAKKNLKSIQRFQLKGSAKGSISYKLLKSKSGIRLDASGTLSVPKKMKKGVYSLTVRVTAGATQNFKKCTKNVTVKVTVR